MRRCLAACLVAACVFAACLMPARAFAQLPSPIDPTRNSFPGVSTTPPSGTSAALALAERWLGDEPFDNPALGRVRVLAVSPLVQRVSREDLRANNREYSEQTGAIDYSGAWGALPLGPLELLAYVSQPDLRLEDNAYTLGRVAQPGAPATIHATTDAREMRAGGGASIRIGAARVGAALEWLRREDTYTYHEDSGSPSSGDQSVKFSGSATGAQFGACTTLPGRASVIELGAAARYTPRLAMTGTQTLDLFSGFSVAPISVTRSAAWEGGLSARATLGGTFHLLLAAGGRGASDWEGFGVKNGAASGWRLGGEFHDPRDPWTFRFGTGQEVQSGVPEPRAGMFALGLGWRFKNAALDIGVLRRSIQRVGQPNSYDDRVVASLALR